MEQSGNDWLMWRKDGICSTDAPVIAGVSPYKSKLQLFNEKISNEVSEEKKYIFNLGHRVEKEIRALYEIETTIEFMPMIFERIDFSFLKASMDGANLDLKRGIEIKLVSKEEFDLGICPVRYYPQIQHQYMVTDFDRIDLILVIKEKGAQLKYKVVTVEKNIRYINELVIQEFDFWFRNVVSNIAPDISNLDFIKAPKDLVKIAKEVNLLNKRYAKINSELKEVTEKLRMIDREISSKFDVNGYKSGKMKIRVYKDGIYVY